MKNLLNDIKNIVYSGGDVEKITLKSIINNGANGSYVIIFIVTILIMLPIPVLSTIFGLIDCIISYQVLINKKNIKLPKKLMNLSIKKTSMTYLIEKISVYINKIESLTRNRLIFILNKKFINFLIFLFSLASVSPIPFLSIFIVFAICFILFGYFNKDGLFVLIGIFFGFINLFLQIMFLILGKTLFLKFLNFFH